MANELNALIKLVAAMHRHVVACEADNTRLRGTIRALLLSADAAWELDPARYGGHDWPNTCAYARRVLHDTAPGESSGPQESRTPEADH
jgi:hypothetical protein